MGRRTNAHKERKAFACFLGFSFLGVLIFVLLPFLDVVRRSFFTVMSGDFAGIENYRKVLNNDAFLLAVKNTVHFALTGISLLLVTGLAAALVLSRMRDITLIKSLYLFPMAMPTATVVIIWRMFFYKQDFGSLVASYLWKNLGYTIVLWLAGIAGIPREQVEAAKMDGANKWQCFFYIKLPCLKGSLYTIVILSFLNSFKIYREAYLVAGSYPGKALYLLQHLFNNWYVNLELDKMSAATVLVGGFLFLFIMLLNHLWNRDSFS
ncbi:MAG: sugar ABC transporter permease [Bacteroidales bacterium]|nr:sugar ABC transporter permease [Lachnoclostridium sp.]MCM1383518.1 sugar ABC transporter permease [Lachnoclostridium sp.]MCM1464199.1 sugar ABC transporter permease [Bacteroidales bacterium]